MDKACVETSLGILGRRSDTMTDSLPTMADSVPLIRQSVRHRIGTVSVMPSECCPPSSRNPVRHGPAHAPEALRRIAALYQIEDDIKGLALTGEAKQLHRLTHSKPHVETFFAWVDQQLQVHRLRPATLFTKALNYVRERRPGL